LEYKLNNNLQLIADELNIKLKQVRTVKELFDTGATVPFIARYRKEATENLDENILILIRNRIEQLDLLDARKITVLKSLKDQDYLTDELQKKVMESKTMPELEDIYLPFKPKRRTRGSIAKDKGLEPLADIILKQESDDIKKQAKNFITDEVLTAADAVSGACDIISERINENIKARKALRDLFKKEAVLQSKVIKSKQNEASKYKDYFDWKEPAFKAPSHRVLAILRGTKEGFLTHHILPDKKDAIKILESLFIKSGHCPELKAAVAESYKRLLSPSLETEMRNEIKKTADTAAIDIFSENLKELLLSPPLGGKPVLAIDPGFRTGCKTTVLNSQGGLETHCTIFPVEPNSKVKEAEAKIKELCSEYRIEAIAIGNGTGGRETLKFCRNIGLDKNIQIVMVNESGASIYSASKAAQKEFKDYDITVRGSVSIGRRLMDPLSELVKIEPKSIGVGQYQHDVDQKALKSALDDVVISCVNAVGVEVNTASTELLSYVSGLSQKLASGIVKYRDSKGPFKTRNDLLKVSGVGEKIFEQSAGFIRINNGKNPLDASAVHPESYPVVEAMAKNLNCTVNKLINKADIKNRIVLKDYLSETIGMPTLTDIINELEKPGRDPRKEFISFSFAEGINCIEDLKKGIKVPGIITNVTAFGAFVDIGVHQDGLVHISKLSDEFVKNPLNVVKVHQKVSVKVIDIDIKRKRISLSMVD
jgi:protein Tex